MEITIVLAVLCIVLLASAFYWQRRFLSLLKASSNVIEHVQLMAPIFDRACITDIALGLLLEEFLETHPDVVGVSYRLKSESGFLVHPNALLGFKINVGTARGEELKFTFTSNDDKTRELTSGVFRNYDLVVNDRSISKGELQKHEIRRESA